MTSCNYRETGGRPLVVLQRLQHDRNGTSKVLGESGRRVRRMTRIEYCSLGRIESVEDRLQGVGDELVVKPRPAPRPAQPP